MAKVARNKINLALQGGGAHGAFTWGVLEGLMEDERIEIEGISGTSAGAVNAVIVADGLAQGGPKEATERLGKFWRAVSLDGELPTMQREVIDRGGHEQRQRIGDDFLFAGDERLGLGTGQRRDEVDRAQGYPQPPVHDAGSLASVMPLESSSSALTSAMQ